MIFSKWLRKSVYGLGVCLGIGTLVQGKAALAADATTIRVISTTDVHNQISSHDFDGAVKSRSASLAQLDTMIRDAKSEMSGGTSVVLDVGDSIYGYEADYNIAHNKKGVQPMYQAMTKIGYDAITLGNHDFDYGLTFIKDQLNRSGLASKCLVSNLVDMSTGKNPWNGTKIITRKVKTEKGSTTTVKIGIVGATRPALSSYFDYDGVAYATGVISSVKKNAEVLKKQGADVVIAMVHVGMGNNKSTDANNDVAYALTKIAAVDCVMCGHEHRNFPSTDTSVTAYYALPGVNQKTGLINNKPVVMVADHAKGIGVADITLRVTGSNKIVVGAKAQVRKCTKEVQANQNIEAITDKDAASIQSEYQKVVGKVSTGSAINNYFGVAQDCYPIQVNNEAKIRYGLWFQGTRDGKKYASYPVIAYSKYYTDGSEGNDDYVHIADTMTEAQLMHIQRVEHNNNNVYWITGAQLKKWLEWAASVYAQKNEEITSDSMMRYLTTQEKKDSLIGNDWLGTLGSHVVFDGIEYTFDLTQPARYDNAGNIINKKATRLKSLTYNGKTIYDNSKLLVVSNTLSANNYVVGELTNQRLTKKSPLKTIDYLRDYVKEQSEFGLLRQDNVDNNWKLITGGDGKRIVRSSSLSTELAPEQKWYKGHLRDTDEHSYYMADFSGDDIDKTGPMLVLASTNNKVTNLAIPIRVQYSDKSGVSYVKYMTGSYGVNDSRWANAKKVSGNLVSFKANGVYTFMAQDTKGNRTLKKIRISNYNPNVLEIPDVDKVTNRKKAVTGYTQGGLTVCVKIGSKTYTATAKGDGSFSCGIKKLSVGQAVYVHVKNKSGRKSANVKMIVDRGGPNTPTLNKVTNKTKTFQGNLNDKNCFPVIFVGSDYAYVPKGKVDLYKASKKFTSKRIILSTPYSVKNGKFKMSIPPQITGREINIFSVDNKARVSNVETMTVKKKGINPPVLPLLYQNGKSITVKSSGYKKDVTVILTVGGKKYKGTTRGGRITFKVSALKMGQKVTAYIKSGGKKSVSNYGEVLAK